MDGHTEKTENLFRGLCSHWKVFLLLPLFMGLSLFCARMFFNDAMYSVHKTLSPLPFQKVPTAYPQYTDSTWAYDELTQIAIDLLQSEAVLLHFKQYYPELADSWSQHFRVSRTANYHIDLQVKAATALEALVLVEHLVQYYDTLKTQCYYPQGGMLVHRQTVLLDSEFSPPSRCAHCKEALLLGAFLGMVCIVLILLKRK